MIVIKKRYLKFVILINPNMIYTLFNNNFVRLLELNWTKNRDLEKGENRALFRGMEKLNLRVSFIDIRPIRRILEFYTRTSLFTVRRYLVSNRCRPTRFRLHFFFAHADRSNRFCNKYAWPRRERAAVSLFPPLNGTPIDKYSFLAHTWTNNNK